MSFSPGAHFFAEVEDRQVSIPGPRMRDDQSRRPFSPPERCMAGPDVPSQVRVLRNLHLYSVFYTPTTDTAVVREQ